MGPRDCLNSVEKRKTLGSVGIDPRSLGCLACSLVILTTLTGFQQFETNVKILLIGFVVKVRKVAALRECVDKMAASCVS